MDDEARGLADGLLTKLVAIETKLTSRTEVQRVISS